MEHAEMMGVLTMTHASPHHFVEQDKVFLQAAANQMSLALRNAQTHSSLRQYVADLDTLFSITRLISHSLMDKDFLDQALYIALTS
jgi:GAF domain-containing protein